jgi:hypothetical protein
MNLPSQTTFPRLRLVLPPLVPLSLLFLVISSEMLNLKLAKSHDSLLWIGVLFQLTALFVVLYEVFTLKVSFEILNADRESRTLLNKACVSFSVGYIALCLGGILLALLKF